MISSRLKGGLGNQMFQISAAYALSLRNNDVTGFDFNQCQTGLQGNPSTHYSNTIFSKINNIVNPQFDTVYRENGFSYLEIPYSKNLQLDGYFQSEKYFLDFKDEIIDLFYINDKHKQLILETLPKNDSLTSVHIRRGDYLQFPEVYPSFNLDYYKKAMSLIQNTTFVFISDDINWVQENFNGDNIIYSPFKDEIFDLTLMTLCNNNIIANSTFSWWGAYLNKNKNKKVIGPIKWFSDNSGINQSDIIPTDWIRI